jgi:hypothetical protein
MKNKNNLQVSITFIVFLCLFNLFNTIDAYAIKPERVYAAKPDAIGLKYETYKIKVNDLVTLNSWACLQKDLNKPFIIISGPDAGNMANSLGQAKALFDAGYNIILYDYRGFGESSDFIMDPNMMYYNEFSEDLSTTIKYIESKFKPKSIVLYGLSMGTALSRMNIDVSKSVKGLVLDSFMIDPKLVIERIYVLKKKAILVPQNASEYAQSNTIKLDKPVLIFSGLKDAITKTVDYNDFLVKNPNAKLVTWDCNHIECFTSMGAAPNQYIVEFSNFIKTI